MTEPIVHGSRSPRLLVVERDQRHLRSLTRILKSMVGDVVGQESLAARLSDDEFDLVVVNYDTLDAETRRRLVAQFGGGQARTRLLFLSEGNCKDDFVDLFGGHSLTNLVAKTNNEVDPEELIVTIRKILTRNIFGLEKYFIWGVEPVRMSIRSTADKRTVVAAAEEYANSLGVNERFVSRFSSVADEFVTNALFNAPTDAAGNPRYAALPRSSSFALEAGEEVIVKFCCDGRRLGISTSDPFGSLAVERILDYLAKCMRKGDDQVDEKQGGAGLGFYTIFESVSHLVVNIRPTQQTELVGLLDVRGSFRDFTARPKSFNIFCERG